MLHMDGMDDIFIKGARLRGKDELYSIYIQNGKIISIKEAGETQKAQIEIDAKGRLVTESYVIAHVHLDKVGTWDIAGDTAVRAYHRMDNSSAKDAIMTASKVKASYTVESVKERASRYLMLAKKYGVSHIRAFADVDTKAKLMAVDALCELREQLKSEISIQVVAFPQDGVIMEPGAEELVRKALDKGADVVGGIPWIERTEEDQRAHIQKMINLAVEYNKPVAMLVDDAANKELHTVEMLAEMAHRAGLDGRVEACHARALQLYDDSRLREVAQKIRTAGMGLVTDPHTGPLHIPVEKLARYGVDIAIGQDDCSDAYYPYGRCKMTEVAFLASHLLWRMDYEGVDRIYDMVTTSPARIIGVNDFGLKAGNTANLVILPAKSVMEALTFQVEPDYVVSQGHLTLRR
jgi:cytosine deaminase